MTELYKKHRPTTFDEMLGSNSALLALQKQIEKQTVPHALLFSGPSGCGKTTAARILANSFPAPDILEMNCSDFRGIDTVREIRDRLQFNSIYGDTRVWIIDEAHKLTNDAQNAFLKLLEDPPQHVYFILCTTEPKKLIKTVKTRCTEVVFKNLSEKELNNLVTVIAKKEGKKISGSVMDAIIDNSEGSARKALVLLDSVLELKTEKEQLEIIPTIEEGPPELIEFCRNLFSCAKALPPSPAKWKTLSSFVMETAEEPETVRHVTLRYFASCLAKNSPATDIGEFCVSVIQEYSKPFYDSGKAGLLAATALSLFSQE